MRAVSRGNYSSGKRQREADKARKKREKLERRRRKREEGPSAVPIVEADDMTGPLPSVEEVMADMEDRATSPKGAAAIPCRLFVGGLSWGTTEDELRAAFAEFGQVTDTVIIKDRDTGRSRGFGFVTMADRKDAAKAMDALNDSELGGRTIAVNVATER